MGLILGILLHHLILVSSAHFRQAMRSYRVQLLQANAAPPHISPRLLVYRLFSLFLVVLLCPEAVGNPNPLLVHHLLSHTCSLSDVCSSGQLRSCPLTEFHPDASIGLHYPGLSVPCHTKSFSSSIPRSCTNSEDHRRQFSLSAW